MHTCWFWYVGAAVMGLLATLALLCVGDAGILLSALFVAVGVIAFNIFAFRSKILTFDRNALTCLGLLYAVVALVSQT